ncbi:hypothetical protein [Methanohalophilus sp.]|uniref:hypothetical protein n=1 Tax=Methanohalophilus sp. TaxID=1966352 RepID=UPI002625F1AF|nr:hypothetical protein [Methanohalophilus sp.]MDK2892049.1 hypothetical protein [Methanohalophilus sp.]
MDDESDDGQKYVKDLGVVGVPTTMIEMWVLLAFLIKMQFKIYVIGGTKIA